MFWCRPHTKFRFAYNLRIGKKNPVSNSLPKDQEANSQSRVYTGLRSCGAAERWCSGSSAMVEWSAWTDGILNQLR